MQKYFKKYLLVILVFLLFTLGACKPSTLDGGLAVESSPEISNDLEDDSSNDPASAKDEDDEDRLFIHFIDVGQGDAIFIEDGNSTMLIDAGDNSARPIVLDYLLSLGVETIDYIIGTHPHADHLGGLSEIIRNFQVENIIMPRVGHTTRTFEELLLTIKDKGLKVTSPRVYDTYKLNKAEFTIIAPSSEDYSNLNDYSVGIKLDYMDHSFIFTGDGEKASEEEMLALDISLDADVFKVAHHGSSSSNTREFLEAINPSISVIQVGKDNRYNHPHVEVLELFSSLSEMDVYRNDHHGNIVIISDGSDLIVETEFEFSKDLRENKEEDYYLYENLYVGNINSKVFHLDTCRSLPREDNRVYFESREEALDKDFKQCGICNP